MTFLPRINKGIPPQLVSVFVTVLKHGFIHQCAFSFSKLKIVSHYCRINFDLLMCCRTLIWNSSLHFKLLHHIISSTHKERCPSTISASISYSSRTRLYLLFRVLIAKTNLSALLRCDFTYISRLLRSSFFPRIKEDATPGLWSGFFIAPELGFIYLFNVQ